MKAADVETTMPLAQRRLMGKRFKLARRVRSVRLDRTFYRDCHLTPAQLAAIEAGDNEPTAHQFMAYAATCGVRLDWLLGNPEDHADELPKNGKRIHHRAYTIR